MSYFCPEELPTFMLQALLYPFALLYSFAVRLRNCLFDCKLLPSEQFPVPVICVGNLAVGGTGKTPMTEYLIRLLKPKYRLAVLSRGYKRQTKGFILSSQASKSTEIGDEPYQIKMKFPDIHVAVDEDRRDGIRHLLSLPENIRPEVILLDDAFQHRYVRPSFSIVLTDCHRLFYQDHLLPVGRLREPVSGIKRADLVVVTKCDVLMEKERFAEIRGKLNLYGNQKLFFSKIVYDEPIPLFSNKLNSLNRDMEVLLIAGIASPEPFIKEVKRRFLNVSTVLFPDHHAFTEKNFAELSIGFGQMNPTKRFILTTEKDAVRLKGNPDLPEQWKSVIYYLPIRVEFFEGNLFDNTILEHIK